MKFIFLVLLIIQFGLSIWFHRRQNQAAFTGGPISWPKAIWLFHAVFAWFLVPLVFLAHPEVHSSLKLVLAAHSISWWLRGAAEFVMIYKFYNWSPRYGISHDAVNAVLVLALATVTAKMWPDTPVNWMAFVCSMMIILMHMFEIAFAALFLNVRGEADHKIYYADNTEKWRFINWLTKVGLTFGISHAVIQAIAAIYYF